jgi:hypothetical protein
MIKFFSRLFAIFSLVLIVSCQGDKEPAKLILVESNGRANHVVFVMNNDLWKGRVGEALIATISKPIDGLPQKEAQLDVSQLPKKLFGSMMSASRSIIEVEIGAPEDSFTLRRDVYAKPQIILSLKAKNKNSMIDLIRERGDDMIRLIKMQDIKNIQTRNRRRAFDSSKLKTFKNLGISMTIPVEFGNEQIVDTGDFLWMTQRLSGGIAVGDGGMNILAYEIPLDEEHPFTPETVIDARDRAGEQHIPGSKEDQYMITEKARTPVFYKMKFNGYDCLETRSTWEMKNDYMAGPFLNYAIADWENDRIIVLEGFVYAPSVDKRDYIMELEAIMRSIQINN